MIVMKFGGTSVGSVANIENVCNIVKGRMDKKPLVVTSAHSKVTDLLIHAAKAAVAGNPDVTPVSNRQLGLIKELGLDESLVTELLSNLAELLKGISMIEELTPRTMDMVMSFGERMSSRVLAAAMSKQTGLNVEAYDAYDLGLRTDKVFGSATPDPKSYPEVARKVRSIKADVIITTGFIAKSEDGHITTLGRSGSDFSATIFGEALDAEEVEIWTDVNGVMTADPSICKAAKSLPEMTFNEAGELAWYGAKVLHPSTIQPAVNKGIPVRVLNTMEPDNAGTVIVAQTSAKNQLVKSVVYKENLRLITIVSSRMLGAPGFMAKVFAVFAKHGIDINMIATSEVAISMTTAAPMDVLEKAKLDMEEFATSTIRDEQAIICLVGEGMAGVKGTAAKFFQSLAEANVNVEMISQGAREINIAALVHNNDVNAAVLALHKSFFEN